MRPLFTDKWNSFWHVFFGALSVHYHIIIPAFVLYQVIDWHDKNMICDLSEFFVGYGMYSIIKIFYLNKIQYRKRF